VTAIALLVMCSTFISLNGNALTGPRAYFAMARDGLFPAALCYTKIVPVDEVVTLTLYYREDDQLARLMLTEAQKAHLDRLWDELHYISHDAEMLVDARHGLADTEFHESELGVVIRVHRKPPQSMHAPHRHAPLPR